MVSPKVPATLKTPHCYPMSNHSHSFVSKNGRKRLKKTFWRKFLPKPLVLHTNVFYVPMSSVKLSYEKPLCCQNESRHGKGFFSAEKVTWHFAHDFLGQIFWKFRCGRQKSPAIPHQGFNLMGWCFQPYFNNHKTTFNLTLRKKGFLPNNNHIFAVKKSFHVFKSRVCAIRGQHFQRQV
jgi:hypothetical protein